MSTLSLLSEEDRGRLQLTGNLGDVNYRLSSSPHNILRQNYPYAPIKKCELASLEKTTAKTACEGNPTTPTLPKSDETSCMTTQGCVFSEDGQEIGGADYTPLCKASTVCDSTAWTKKACRRAITKNIKDAMDDVSGFNAMKSDESACAQDTSGNLAACEKSNGGNLDTTVELFCNSLTEWECRHSGLVDDPRYDNGTSSPISDIDQGEKSATCYVTGAPSQLGTQDPATVHADMTERNTPLYANPNWPKVLGDANLSYKSSALVGTTTSPTNNRGHPYQSKTGGASGRADDFKFDGYVPDMTYVRPEYDIAGGYGGRSAGATLEFGNYQDVSQGYVTWYWNNQKQKYEIAKASLVMTDTEGHRRVIQPDADAASRSQRQVSLDTMLQFADAIGITAVDNEQALYEWKLDALQTLLDRINTSHKATAFTYAATGHQLLNLLERFQAHSGATDDMLYYMVTVMSTVSGNVNAALSVMKNFAFGSNDPTFKWDTKDLQDVPGLGADKEIEYLPRVPKAYNGAAKVDRAYNPRFIVNPSTGIDTLARLPGTKTNAATAKYRYNQAMKDHKTATSGRTSSPLGVMYNASGQVEAGTGLIAPGVPDLSDASSETPSKIKAYVNSLSFSPKAFRPDGMNSSVPDVGDANAVILSDPSLGHDVVVEATGASYAASPSTNRAYSVTGITVHGKAAGVEPLYNGKATSTKSTPPAGTAGKAQAP